ncbi:MAG: hypothetical protein J5621_04035 [Paludibacteraceae bacterium]|nr:hypothetical protein [Paludibacteraceae bacterium]
MFLINTRIKAVSVALWAAVLSCFAMEVNLNFYVGNDKIKTVAVTGGETYVFDELSPDSMAAFDCHDNHFVGWSKGAPCAEGVWSQPDSLITPTANTNYYAVFSKETACRFTRISSLENLTPGGQYLIVSYRVVDNEPHYYAMGASVGTYEYHCEECDTVSNASYDCDDWGMINAKRLYPKDDIISDPDRELVWTMTGTPDHCRWENGSNGLCIVNNLKYWLVETGATVPTEVSVKDGAYSIRSWYVDQKIIKADTALIPIDTLLNVPFDTIIGGEPVVAYRDTVILSDTIITPADTILREPTVWRYLKFVDDEISTARSFFYTSRKAEADHPIYLYKREPVYTSFLDHSSWTTHLNMPTGNIDLTETSHGAGVTLPTVELPSEELCDEWKFSGWTFGAPIEPTRATLELHPAGKYQLHMNDEILFPVFDNTHYVRINSESELNDSDVVVFVNRHAHKAIRYDTAWTKASWWRSRSVVFSEDSSKILSIATPEETEWTYRAYDRVFYQGEHFLSCQGKAEWYDKIRTEEAPFTLGYSYGGQYFFLTQDTTESEVWFRDGYIKDATRNRSAWCESSKMVIQGSLKDFVYFDIYKKMGYSTSYPHCTPYAVHLHGCGGAMANGAAGTLIAETNVGEGVVLPAAVPDCAEQGWTFLGWSLNADKPAFRATAFAEYEPAGSVFHPAKSEVHLYAIYTREADDYAETGLREYSSWPHCLPFSVHLDACGGKCDVSDMVEATAEAGVRLPEPMPTADCVAARWQFAGWLDHPIYVEMADLAVEPIPAGSVYHPLRPADTLYAVYRQQNYYSYPACHHEVEALYWEKDNEDDAYVVMESYLLGDMPDMNGSLGDPVPQEDGTYRVRFNPTVLPPHSRSSMTWGGVTSEIQIPYIVKGDVCSSGWTEELAGESHDVYVTPGSTLTIDSRCPIRTLTVCNGAILNVENELYVHHLVLFTDDNSSAPVVNVGSNGRIDLIDGELFLDYRLDGSRNVFFSLPFDADLSEVTYSAEEANGGAPTYINDYRIRYYDGAQRVANGTADCWTDMPTDETLHAGTGYRLTISDQADIVQPDGRKHTKRVMRFTMRPDNNMLNNAEYGRTKGASVFSAEPGEQNVANKGWNLIGNPYMSVYATGEAVGSGALHCGEEEVPYLTVFDVEANRFAQVMAANYRLRPLETALIQIGEGDRIDFAATESAVPRSLMPRHSRATLAPLYTGIRLSGSDQTDRAGIVLDETFTPAYEIGGDLAKMTESNMLNLYTIGAGDQQLAFIAISDSDARTPIPVGVMLPAAGTYTFAYDEKQYGPADDVASLVLIDRLTNTETDLLCSDYVFAVTEADTLNDRFAILPRRAKQATTGIVDVQRDNVQCTKVLRNGELYILKNNKTYTAFGVEIRR